MMSSWRQELMTRLEPLALRPEREAEIVEELSLHLDDRVRDLMADGVPSDEARRMALDDLDVPGALTQQLSAIGTRAPLALPPPGPPARGRWISAIWQDVRYTVSSLRRTPAFALTVIAALALTIGPTTAILSVGNWLLWRPAPGVADPDRLAVVYFGDWRDNGSVSPRRVSALNLIDLEAASETLAGIAGWQESSVSVAADGALPRQAGSAHATVNFFDLLGIRPAAGRAFTEDDDRPPYGSPVVMLSHTLANGLFGTPEAAVGQEIIVNGRRMSVVGVQPHGFVGARPFSRVDVWFPSWTYFHVHHIREASMRSRAGRGTSGVFYTFVVRLAPDVTFEALQAELDVLVPSLAERYPEDNRAFATMRARVYPGLGPNELQREQFAGLVRNLLLVGGALLLLGCANVANLLIFRGVRRQHERAVRVALGASRRRLVQLLLTESCLLAVAGAALGIGLAVWLKTLIQTLLLTGAVGADVTVTVPMDVRVLAATLGLSLACGVVAGIVPAWLGSSSRIGAQLGRGGVRTSAGGSRVRAGFAMTQLALSLALVTGAVLLVVSLHNLAAIDVGFEPRGVSVHAVPLDSHGYTPERGMAYNRQLLERLSSEPALRGVSFSVGYPPSPVLGASILDPGGDGKATIDVFQDFVTDGYFRLLAQPVVRGRVFTSSEAMAPAGPDGALVVLSDALARRLFGEANPLGQRIKMSASMSEHEEVVVIGVVGDIRSPGGVLAGAPERSELMMYSPFSHGGSFSATRPFVMVRSDRSSHEVGAVVQTHAAVIEPSLPLSPPRLLTDVMAQQVARQRVFAWVLSLLGAMGFVLAAVGLYGLLAQMVSERTRELGIRMALGATRTHVMGLVLKQAVWIAIVGGVAGLGLAAFGSRLVETQLFGLTRLEPWVYAASAASLVAVIFTASIWPARAATRIEPVEALRRE